MTRVAILGLGAMGSALARAQLAAGTRVTVWNRTPGRATELDALGAVRAATLEDALRDVEVAIACVSNDDAMRALLPALAALRGRTLVNLTNGTPEQARRIAQWADEHGVAHVDGGIMATPDMIGAPHALVLYAGDARAFERHHDVLARFGVARFVGDDPGRAALLDLALLAGMYGLFAGALHAIAMGRAGGVSATEVAELLVPWLGAMGAAVPAIAAQVDAGDHRGGGSQLAMQRFALDNIVAASEAAGVDPSLATLVRDWVARCVDAGHGEDDLGRLVEVMTRPT